MSLSENGSISPSGLAIRFQKQWPCSALVTYQGHPGRLSVSRLRLPSSSDNCKALILSRANGHGSFGGRDNLLGHTSQNLPLRSFRLIRLTFLSLYLHVPLHTLECFHVFGIFRQQVTDILFKFSDPSIHGYRSHLNLRDRSHCLH